VVANPAYAEQLAAHRRVLERNPFALDLVVEKHLPTFATKAEQLIGADERCVDCSRLTLVVGYPFQGNYAVTVEGAPDGFTRAELFRQIVRVYAAMYEGAVVTPTRQKLQSRIDSPNFGTAWHRLEDLAVEQVLLQKRADGSVLAWVSIGS
jgi:hypothetical protein